jgi:hypothetical protein
MEQIIDILKLQNNTCDAQAEGGPSVHGRP